MIRSEDFTFQSGGETLAATIDWNANGYKPTVLSIHGGGFPAKKRATPTAHYIAGAGHSCLRFDFSGQGESTGEMKQSSFDKRLNEALDATRFLDLSKPITVIATSMGGPTAMQLLKHVNIGTLVLFCPAVYAPDAFHVPFDERLTAILRRENSFREADMTALVNFRGKFFHLFGEADPIIPHAVNDMYRQHSPKDAEFITIPGAGHNIHDFLAENPEEQKRIFGKILSFME